MAKTPAVWTVRNGNSWQVKREGNSKPISSHHTQKNANKFAREVAIKNQCEHKIQGRDGRIVNSNSYGNDPCPPRDKK